MTSTSKPAAPALVTRALAMGAFAIGTTEFAAMSLLPFFSAGLGIDTPTAGHVISAYALGVVVGLSVGETTLGTTVGNLGFEKTEFPKPVFHGDTIYSETEVVDRRESKSRPQWGIVTFEHRGKNQHGDLVVRCVRQAMMRKKPA